MSETNNKTLDAYNAHVDAYIQGTPQEVTGEVRVWIDDSLAGLPTDAHILELGSAFGRDALYMESKGYTVQRTDASSGFVDWLNAHGQPATTLNLITDELSGPYDLVFADAVLLHLNRDETREAIAKIHNALTPQGRFSFCVKAGTGEEWKEDKLGAPRYFCYWQPSQLDELLKETGFSNTSIAKNQSPSRPDTTWLHIIASK